jgi:hypothetical protein
MAGIGLTVALLVLTSAMAVIGWAGGVRAIAGPGLTGKPVGITDSYRYGLRHLASSWSSCT